MFNEMRDVSSNHCIRCIRVDGERFGFRGVYSNEKKLVYRELIDLPVHEIVGIFSWSRKCSTRVPQPDVHHLLCRRENQVERIETISNAKRLSDNVFPICLWSSKEVVNLKVSPRTRWRDEIDKFSSQPRQIYK
jgi:hypothetical protein